MHQLLYTEEQRMLGGPIIGWVAIVLLLIVVVRMKNATRLVRTLSIATLLVGAILVALVSTLRLETRYYTDTVEFQFSSLFTAPFEVVSLDSITAARILTYNPSDYGGWGVKGNADTRVYNTSGEKGILFTFKSGSKLLLGTQEPNSLKAALIGHYTMAD